MNEHYLVALCNPTTKKPVSGRCFVPDRYGTIVMSTRPELLSRKEAMATFSHVKRWLADRVVLMPADAAMRQVSAKHWRVRQ